MKKGRDSEKPAGNMTFNKAYIDTCCSSAKLTADDRVSAILYPVIKDTRMQTQFFFQHDWLYHVEYSKGESLVSNVVGMQWWHACHILNYDMLQHVGHPLHPSTP